MKIFDVEYFGGKEPNVLLRFDDDAKSMTSQKLLGFYS